MREAAAKSSVGSGPSESNAVRKSFKAYDRPILVSGLDERIYG